MLIKLNESLFFFFLRDSEALENVCDQVAFGFNFLLGLLRKWCKISGPIT